MRQTAALFVLLCGLLPAPAAAQSGPRNCTTLSQILYVRDVLDEYYFWYRELPRLNAANFASPESYLDAARYLGDDEEYWPFEGEDWADEYVGGEGLRN